MPVVIGALAISVVVGACGSTSSNSSTATTSSRASASASSSSTPSSTPFKVLLYVPTSGAFAVAGQEELDGFKAAVNVINGEGGILHHKVQITVVNDQDVGTTAVSEAQQQVASGKTYNLVVPGINGADAIPLAAVYAHTPVLQVTSAAEAQLDVPSKYPNLFMSLNNFPANEQAIMTALKKKGITKIAYISGDDSSGIDAGQAVVAAAKAAGITVTANVLVPDTAVDAKSQFQQALASNPQAIVIGAFTSAAPVILAARAALGNTLPLYGDAFFGSFPLETVLKTPALMKNITIEQFPFLVKGSSAQSTKWYTTFNTAFSKLDPKPAINLNAGVVPYNAIMLARAAAIKAGSIDGEAMAKAMPQVTVASQVPDFVGDTSTGIFSPTQHQLAVAPSDFGLYPAGPTVNGVLVPGQ